MRSHPEARNLYLIAQRTGTLKGCRIVAKLVCPRGHRLGIVYMIENRPVVALRQKVQRSTEDFPAALAYERRHGIRLVARTESQILVDVLDENDNTAASPVLRGDCSCRPPVRAVTREWLADVCRDLDLRRARQRRVVLE